jgi:hypothetical protein
MQLLILLSRLSLAQMDRTSLQISTWNPKFLERVHLFSLVFLQILLDSSISPVNLHCIAALLLILPVSISGEPVPMAALHPQGNEHAELNPSRVRLTCNMKNFLSRAFT